MVELGTLLYMTVLGMTMGLLFLESRFSASVTAAAVYGTMAAAMAALVAVYRAWGVEAAMRLYTPVVHVPSLLLFMFFSRYRGWRVVFQPLSAILFCFVIHHTASLLYYLSGRSLGALIVTYAVVTALILWLLLRFVRPLFRRILTSLQRGWWLICLVLACYYALVIYLIPGYAGLDLSGTVLKAAITLLMIGFYTVLMFLFSSVQKEMEARHSAQLAALQLSALRDRIGAIQGAEEMVRTERHNLRHRLQTAAELVARGELTAAQDFLEASQERLDAHPVIRWCRPPVLDAVFSSYFDQAQRQGIRVDAQIALPEQLPVDEGELAIVVANALENAIHACEALPPEERMLRCKVICRPGIMLEISNPCAKTVRLDEKGLPVSEREGHGLGVRSISDFCRVHGAVCQFEVKGGWFWMRLVL